MTFRVDERRRITDWRDPRARSEAGTLASDESYGNNGLFHLPPLIPGPELRCIVSDGLGWEHVSVSIWRQPDKTPTWVEMDHVARKFWDAEDTVVQFHPPRSAHVNYHPGCLHLWRPAEGEIPRPPGFMVGPVGVQMARAKGATT